MGRREKSSLSFRKKLLIAALSIFSLVFIMASFFGKKGLIEIFRAQREQKVLLQKVENLENKKRELEKEIKELEENPKAVEKKAREKLGLTKPDELVVIKKEK